MFRHYFTTLYSISHTNIICQYGLNTYGINNYITSYTIDNTFIICYNTSDTMKYALGKKHCENVKN